jgi:chromosome segregation ATPase
MTIPGKGGRPRKWLSDADRVRAHRARKRGDVEPPTFEEMSAGDDELARVLRRQSELEVELADARQDVRWLEHELAETEAKAAQLDSELRALRTDRAELLIQVAELNERVRQLLSARIDTTRHEPTPLGNRATRRRVARQRRR